MFTKHLDQDGLNAYQIEFFTFEFSFSLYHSPDGLVLNQGEITHLSLWKILKCNMESLYLPLLDILIIPSITKICFIHSDLKRAVLYRFACK